MEARFCTQCGLALNNLHCKQCNYNVSVEPGNSGRIIFSDPNALESPRVVVEGDATSVGSSVQENRVQAQLDPELPSESVPADVEPVHTDENPEVGA